MLEVRHLSKTYKTKGGVQTKALDDVSITFAEKGMVFILGKSGSGKSTLLNVCGGLDRMDSGEILIKGRSSAEKEDFDFDSYRNTFVGFVFQEYNVLDEFTVEENVALALELQHRKSDPEVISAILADVEMQEFARRKPNTLSGGQKQRVAIARALVKNPQIIMADEPTGALDSNTGKQVFDTLKNLSKDKLVLVVSHDREFAEQYGDRIIELKDGKIISDMTRSAEEDTDDKNVRFAGTDTVFVQSGEQLTDEDFENIKEFLSRSKGAAVITSSREKVDSCVRDLRGGEFGETESQPEVREYSAEERKMIRSRLPMRHAIKMGASSLKSKPVRLVFTMLLSIIAFTLFGVFSTMLLYDQTEMTASSLCRSDYEYIQLSKAYYYRSETYEYDKLKYSDEYVGQTTYTFKEYEAFKENYSDAVAYVRHEEGINKLSLSSNQLQFYSSSISGYVLFNDEEKLLAGTLSLADGEIAITDYLFNSLKIGEFKDENDAAINLSESYDSVIGKELAIGNKTYTVKGVFKGEPTPEAYAELEAAAKDNRTANVGGNLWKWNNEKSNGLFACIAVNEETFLSLKNVQSGGGIDISEIFTYNENHIMLTYEVEGEQATVGEYSSYNWISKYSDSSLVTVYGLDGSELSALPQDGIAISKNGYVRFISNYLDNYVRNSFSQAMANGLYGEGEEDNLWYRINQMYGDDVGTTEFVAVLEDIHAFMDEYEIPLPAITAKSGSDNSERGVTLAGVFLLSYGDSYFVGDALYDELYVPNQNPWTTVNTTKYVVPKDAFITSILVPFDHTDSLARAMIALMDTRGEDDSTVLIVNPLMEEINMVNNTVDSMSTVFLWVGIVLAVFAFLLMFNFISASISAKKKEIGILRAIGSRKLDVFKIFLSEALIIAAVCFVVATAASFGVCALLNWALTESAALLSTNLLAFGPLSVLCILIITLATAIVATVIPVAIYSRKAPVESIRAL